jgi:hypothetical protein
MEAPSASTEPQLLVGRQLLPWDYFRVVRGSEPSDGSHAEAGVGELSTRNHGLELLNSLYRKTNMCVMHCPSNHPLCRSDAEGGTFIVGGTRKPTHVGRRRRGIRRRVCTKSRLTGTGLYFALCTLNRVAVKLAGTDADRVAALHTDGGGCTLSVDREVKMEILGKH